MAPNGATALALYARTRQHVGDGIGPRINARNAAVAAFAKLINADPTEVVAVSSTLEAENPTLWLSEKPTNYAGEYPRQPEPGNWYFDGGTRELVYVPNSAGHLIVTSNSMKQLRFRVKIIYQTIHAGSKPIRGIGGVSITPSAAYQWW